MKPVTKAQLRKMQQDFELAEQLSRETLKKEQIEKEKAYHEVDDMLGEVF